jgi:hypothetical protein
MGIHHYRHGPDHDGISHSAVRSLQVTQLVHGHPLRANDGKREDKQVRLSCCWAF